MAVFESFKVGGDYLKSTRPSLPNDRVTDRRHMPTPRTPIVPRLITKGVLSNSNDTPNDFFLAVNAQMFTFVCFAVFLFIIKQEKLSLLKIFARPVYKASPVLLSA